MKLKKIVSLAAASLMAISMLAGCNTTEQPAPSQPTDPSTGISADVEKLVTDKIPSYVSFKDSADLDADLKYAVEFAGVTNVLPQYVLYDQLVEIGTNDLGGDIYDRLAKATNTTANITVENIGSNNVLKAAETGASVTIPNAIATKLYVVSSEIGENALKQMIAEEVDKYGIDGYLYSLDNDQEGKGGNFNHEYTISVSTCTKAVNSSGVSGVVGGVDGGLIGGVNGGVIGGGVSAADPAVTFVTVQVVRTSTHQ